MELAIFRPADFMLYMLIIQQFSSFVYRQRTLFWQKTNSDSAISQKRKLRKIRVVSYLKKNTENKNINAPEGASLRKRSKKMNPVAKAFYFIGVVLLCVFEEVLLFFAKLGKKIKEASLSIKVTVAAIVFACVCTGLVVSLTMMVYGEERDVAASDCVIGAKKHIVTAEQLEDFEKEPDEQEAKRALPESRYSVTFDFYSKDDITCVSAERTVGELVELLGITLEESDLMRAEESDVISSDTVISVDEITYGTAYSHTEIKYETEYRDVQTIPKGTQKTHRRGVYGKSTVEYSVTYVNGEETERETVREYTSTYPVSAIVYRGVGGTVTVGGKSVSFSYYIDCDSTFYYAGGITASGLPADEKVVAVDPRVIPLGTEIYIPGIGKRIAADTGGSIKGNIVDICFNRDNPLTASYGRRGVRVYILD